MTPRRTALAAAALVTPALLAAMLVAPTIATAADVSTSESFELVGRFQNDGAEVSAVRNGFLYAINGSAVDIVDISELSLNLEATSVSDDLGGDITSVAVSNDFLAAAVPDVEDKTQPGKVVIMDLDGKTLATVPVGALPDMLTFDATGARLVVANEGEPNGYLPGDADPEGTISIIDVGQAVSGKGNPVRTVRFVGVPRPSLNQYVRVFGPNATIAQDFEPEYITIQGDRAFVSLQENNAIAEVDLRAGRVVAVRGLEFQDHNLATAGLDPSDRDQIIDIGNWPVSGMPMPDAIASFVSGGQTFIVSANEGDARDYVVGPDDAPQGFTEEARVRDLVAGSANTAFTDEVGREIKLDDALYNTVKSMRGNNDLGRLNVTTADGRAGGDTDGDGDIDQLQSFGTRSFSIWTADGTRVGDSGDEIELRIKGLLPDYFNSDNEADDGEIDTFDSRSDNKGPEPEGVAIGEIDQKRMAFIGLERIGGFMVFNIDDPAKPLFVDYVNNRDFALDPTDPSNDSGPEVLSFVAAEDSPNDRALIVVSNEISGSVTIWSPKQP